MTEGEMGREFSSRSWQEICINIFVKDPRETGSFERIKPRLEDEVMELLKICHERIEIRMA
jgi:hypothetical protein